MYITRVDAVYMKEHNDMELLLEYRRRFGKKAPCFNYADFPGTEKMCAGQMYIEALEKALNENKPLEIVHVEDEFTNW